MKKILITGTSNGIGFHTALRLASLGHQVLAISRTIPKQLVDTANITCISVDLSLDSELDKVNQFLSSNWNHLDAIIHNAGSLILKPFSETTREDFEAIYNVNVFGVASLTRVCLPYLAKGSHVVTISSMGGIQGSLKFPGLAAYSSSKGAVITLSELLAAEYQERGISFNVLALGAVQTEMLEKAFKGYKAPILANEMAEYIADFALMGNKYYNGKVLEVALTNP